MIKQPTKLNFFDGVKLLTTLLTDVGLIDQVAIWPYLQFLCASKPSASSKSLKQKHVKACWYL